MSLDNTLPLGELAAAFKLTLTPLAASMNLKPIVSEATETTVGRGFHCTQRIEDPFVSATHFRISQQGQTVRLYDMSSNSTFVNKQKVSVLLISN
jgi:predicted component of type VI protein secretion system